MTKYYAVTVSMHTPRSKTQYDKKVLKARLSGNTIHEALRKCADELFKQYANLDTRNVQIIITSEDDIFEFYGSSEQPDR